MRQPDANRTSESSLKRIRRALECGHASMHVCLSARLSLGFIWSAIGREPTKRKARACRPYTASLMLIGMTWPAPLPHKPIVVIPGQAAPNPTWSGRATRHTRAAPTQAARLYCYPADSGLPARVATNDAERIALCQRE